mgnify:CR=1 FL=1
MLLFSLDNCYCSALKIVIVLARMLLLICLRIVIVLPIELLLLLLFCIENCYCFALKIVTVLPWELLLICLRIVIVLPWELLLICLRIVIVLQWELLLLCLENYHCFPFFLGFPNIALKHHLFLFRIHLFYNSSCAFKIGDNDSFVDNMELGAADVIVYVFEFAEVTDL